MYIHPDWTSPDDTVHDIAILRLTEPLDFKTDFIISQACLPSRMNSSVEMMGNTTSVVVGWNVLSNSTDNISEVLQQLSVYPIDYNDSLCAESVADRKLLFCVERYGGLAIFALHLVY